MIISKPRHLSASMRLQDLPLCLLWKYITMMDDEAETEASRISEILQGDGCPEPSLDP